MTASMVRMPGGGDPMRPETCQRTHAIFDGRMRYDMQFAFKRMEKVKVGQRLSRSGRGLLGVFHAGGRLIPTRPAIKYLAKQRDMEVWLAPVAGTRVLVPFRARADAGRPGGARGVGVRCDPDPGGANGMKTQ